MTRQEAFNKVWNWFIVQGKPRGTDAQGCVYRGAAGVRCAYGVLLPNHHYTHRMERMVLENFKEVLRVHPASLVDMPESDLDFLVELQNAHDVSRDKHALYGALDDFAKKFDLTIPGTP